MLSPPTRITFSKDSDVVGLSLTEGSFSSCMVDGEWLGSRVISVLYSGAEGPGSNLSRDAVG